MFFINVIYFWGSWQIEFDFDNIFIVDFYSLNGFIFIEFMYLFEVSICYFENEFFQVVDLFYGDFIYFMSVFLLKIDYIVQDVVN